VRASAVDRGNAFDLSHGAGPRTAGDRLRRAQGFALTFLRTPKTRPLAAETLPKPEVLLKEKEAAGSLPLCGQLVLWRGLRSGEKRRTGWAFKPVNVQLSLSPQPAIVQKRNFLASPSRGGML